MKKRISAAILALFLILPSLVTGCSSGPDSADTQKPTATPDTSAQTGPEAETEPGETEPEETGRAAAKDSLPDNLSFDGESVRVWTGSEMAKFDAIGEDGGDQVYSAVFYRNIAVEDRLGLSLDYLIAEDTGDAAQNYLNIAEAVRTSVLANSDDYDVVMQRGIQSFQQSVEGLYIDLKSAPYVDLAQPWWWMDTIRDCSINTSRVYFLTGDISLSTFLMSTACFFNKTMLADYGFEASDLYSAVEEGRWTWDEFEKYAANVYEDKNGDGKDSPNDVYAFSWLGYNTNYFSSSAGLKYISRDENGLPVIDFDVERTVALVEKLNHILHDDHIAYKIPSENYQELAVPFNEGRNLFMMARFVWATEAYDNNLRMTDEPYGTLPYPKLSEDLDYMSGSGMIGNFVSVPITCSRVNASFAVIEALCAENYRSVFPAFYETMLKVKYSDEEADARMIDIIHDHVYIDLTNIAGYDTLIGDLISKNNNNFASYYEKKSGVFKNSLAKLIESYEKNG